MKPIPMPPQPPRSWTVTSVDDQMVYSTTFEAGHGGDILFPEVVFATRISWRRAAHGAIEVQVWIRRPDAPPVPDGAVPMQRPEKKAV